MTQRATLLFVDDEERIVNLMRLMFREHYEVFTATSGAAALEIVRSRPIDVIVSDQRMPGMLGTELLAKVCELSPHTMRLLLTGYSDLAAIVGSVNDGQVYRFINKPWNNDDLRASVGEAARIAVELRTAPATIQGTAPATIQRAAPPTIQRAAPPTVQRAAPPTVQRAMSGAGYAAEEATGLLILDDNPRVQAWFSEHFGDQYQVFKAGSISGALDTLEKHDIGIIVTDQALGGKNVVRMLRVLKQQYPMIMTVMLTNTQDSDFVIKLINEVKICRVVFKPVKQGALDLALRAAKQLHQASRSSPALLRREGVSARMATPSETRLAQTILEKMRSRFRWFTRASV